MRCAPFGPTPGSWPSSSIRSWTIPSYTSAPARSRLVVRANRRPRARRARRRLTRFPRLSRQPRLFWQPRLSWQPGKARKARQSRKPALAALAAECASKGAHHLGLHVAQRAVGVTASGKHQVGHGGRGFLGIAGLDGRASDRQVNDLALPVDRHRHKPAARAALDLGVGELLLSVDELALHLRGGGK